MGEQNAKMLRGEKATDIIFAGSEKRKPLGMAEVSLVFDNTDGSSFCPPEYRHEPEISLTRRLYIDGQREYAINKKPCRLKDIISFFASTGLGGRSYSMIQQGQVDRILQAKPEEIREILEEASGTLIFKKRRHEATMKLDNTRLNLSRIEDIVSELVRQKGSLEEQVEQAKKYKEINETLKQAELKLYSHNYHNFKDELVTLNESLEKETLKDAETTRIILEHEEEYERHRSELDESDPEVQALSERIAVVREKIARSETSLLNAEKLLATADDRLDQLNKDIQEDDDHLKDLEQQVNQKSKALSDIEEKIGQVDDLIETLDLQLTESDEQAQVFVNKIEECEDEIKNLERMIESNRLRQESCEREFGKAEREKANLVQRVQLLQSEVDKASILVDSAKVKVSGIRKGLDKELAEKHQLEQDVHHRSEGLRHLFQERDQHKEAYLSCKAKLESIESLIANTGDLRSTLNKLAQASPHQTPIGYGILTDHLKFNTKMEELPHSTRQAIEAWAERFVIDDIPKLNTLVQECHNLEIAPFSVSVLSQLSPISSELIRNWQEQYDAEPLSEYLDCSHPSLKVLLDRLYHLPMLDIAPEALSDLPPGMIVFSAQGVMLHQHGDYKVSGKSGQGALTYKSEVEKLERELKRWETTLARSQGQIDAEELAQQKAVAVIKQITEKQNQQNQSVLDVMATLNASQQNLEHKQNLVVEAHNQLQTAEETCHKFATQLKDLKEALHSLDQEREQIKGELHETREESEHILEIRAEVSRRLESLKIDKIRSTSELQGIKDSFYQVKNQLDIMQSKMNRRYEQKNTLLNDIERAKTERTQLEGDIEHFILEREKFEEELASKREENAEILELIRVIENKIKEHRTQQNILQKSMGQIQLLVEKLRSNLETTIQQATERLHLDLAQHDFERDHDFNRETTTKLVQKLRGQIDAIGPVNMMAIKEFEDLCRREEFIQAQREEIISSVDLLELAIEEIESNSKEKFLATFHILNKEFAELFPILFPGGDAHIELSDQDNPLEAGVEIMVRLPGKKQQNMRLFSGGEKALTAIALIFALLKSKPTPFCFLDEVDAPLDETNVGRYNRVLEALSDRFQFIVITHNRRTMEVLDTLYGVTMQEPGVSKVVGVDMSKDLPVHLKKSFHDTPKQAAGATARYEHYPCERSERLGSPPLKITLFISRFLLTN
jgi:chromosome segregation protein